MSNYYIGLMSGTSIDAIDAALVNFDNEQCQLIAHHSHPIPDELKQSLLTLVEPGDNEIQLMMQHDVALGRLFAEATNTLLSTTKIKHREIKAIGSHGQTLRHYPTGPFPTTLQIADANIIAELTGITTVADFRRRDMAAGGQGAPLAPAFHNVVFYNAEIDQVILNLGGIANITLLPSNNNKASGYDTGPASCLMDNWIQQHLADHYDHNGEWAAKGKVHSELLQQMLKEPYFSLAPPKSTGREHFNLNWLNPYLTHFPNLSAEDVQATLAELTAITISDAIKQSMPNTEQVLVCGGGVHNSYLMKRLQAYLTDQKISSTAQAGIDPEWIEAMAFAWLAKQTLNGKPGNLPEVTGAQHPVILGAIYPNLSN